MEVHPVEKKPKGRPTKASLLKEQMEKQASEKLEVKPAQEQPILGVSDSEPHEPIQAPKAKRVIADSTKEALARGREKMKQINEEKRKAKAALMEQYAEKKAMKMLNEKKAIKQQFGLDDDDDDEEQSEEEIIVMPRKTQKKKVKKVVYVEPESESEEEEIQYVPRKSTARAKAVPVQQPVARNAPQILFW